LKAITGVVLEKFYEVIFIGTFRSKE